MKKSLTRIISVLLCIGMIFTMSSPGALMTQAYAADGSTWVEVSDIAAAAASDKPIAITMTRGGVTYILPTAAATSSGPLAPTVTIGSDGKLTTDGAADTYGWNITANGSSYRIHNSSDMYLYIGTKTNNGVRIAKNPASGADWSVASSNSNYLTANDTGGTLRYLGATTAGENGPDWRAYTSINTNISGGTLQFWELETGGQGEQPIAEWPLIEDELVDGAIVAIYNPDSEVVLTATADGTKLKGVTGKVTDGKLGLTADMVQLDVREENGVFTFVTSDEKFLTCPATGNGLSFADAESDYSKWTLEQQTDGTWYIKSVNAVYNNKQQYLEIHSGFTTYGFQADQAASYKFEFYGENGDAPTPQGPFTVTIEQAEHGTITADKTENIAYNEEVTITMTPEEGYVPYQLFVNGAALNPAATSGVVTVNVKENLTVTGAFKEDTPAPTYNTIAEALAGAEGTSFTVKGVVTLVDGKNVYVQDATGGICLYLTSAATDLDLGDTVIGTGNRATYRGLPELADATYEKSEGMSMTMKSKSIGEITTADICMFVELLDLTVTNINDNNGAWAQPTVTVKDSTGASIDIYKAVVNKTDGEWDVKVGDEVNVYAAVGINNTTLQLRTMDASQIVVKGAPVGPFTITIEQSEHGTVTADMTENIPIGTEVTLTVTPDDGYVLDKLLVNGTETAVGEDGTVKITVTCDTTVSATFKEAGSVVTYDTIAEALAGANGTTFTVKGVVTMVDGKNIYVQDATGGICLFMSTAPSDISLGDTVIGTGKRGAYNGLPELTGATYEKSEGMTLTAKMTTIGELTDADICTYVNIKNLTVTAISGNNTTVSDENRNTINIFKAVTDGLAVGDKINFTGAVGTFNGLQLRNTLASEIKIKGSTGLVTDLSDLTDGSYVVIYNPGNSLAMTSETYNNWYLMPGNAVIDGDQVAEPADNQIWKVTVNDDGSYTFTQDAYTIAAWLDGNYVELTNNGSYNTATSNTWNLDVCNAETSTFYMRNSTLTTTYGGSYIEVYGKKVNGVANTLVFCGYSTGTGNLNEKSYGMQFYIVPEPAQQETGDLVTSLSQLTDGATVAIYSPTHNTAISTKPNGDWYLKANPATVENGEVKNFTSDFVWTVKVNDDGTYSFYSNDNPEDSISVWPSGTYAELTVNTTYNEETVNEWVLSPFSASNHTWYIKSSTLTIEKNGTALPVYIEAYVRNGGEVFSGYAPYSSQLSNTDYALQFYLVDPADAVPEFDDGVWDGILTPGDQYVIYNGAAEGSLGLFKEANYAFDNIPTTIVGSGTNAKAEPGNGAYVFTVGSTGRYYTFKVGDKYLSSNNDEELFFIEPNEDGTVPSTAKWYLYKPEGANGYVIFNKEANYHGSPVCIEYYSSVFSGWTYKANADDTSIFYFNFYHVTEDTVIKDDTVQVPTVEFDCEDFRYIEQDFPVTVKLDDLAASINDIDISFTVGSRTVPIEDYEVSSDGKNYTFTIAAADIDGRAGETSFELKAEVVNSYDIEYSGTKTVQIKDEPFFENLTPAPNAQTKDDKRPVISARVGNVGDNPTFTFTVNDVEITNYTFENGILSYTPTEDMEDGRVTVKMTVTRADGVSAEESWSFTVGVAAYQLYFGQLHSHTTYSDGSGTLDTALEYIASLPESANVQFVAFTDHSNYFDTTSAANPAASLNDASQMTTASKALWDEYRGKMAAFNESHTDILAIPGFEMTWSGGPGHINTYDSEGLVSRNNNNLNNKTNDAGMKLYYATLNDGDSISQFNHPGDTFGNFTDFSYWDEETDAHIFLVEVGNGEGQIGAGGYYPSYEQYTIALDKGWHVAPTNNQDNHKGRWGNANDARDVVLTNDFSVQGIYDAIRALRVYSTEDKNLQIGYTINDEPMGTIFTDENTPEKLNVVATIYDPNSSDSVSKVELIANANTVVKTWNDAAELAEGILTAEIDPEYSYYYLKVTQADGDLAVTAPIWVGDNIAVGIENVTASSETPLVNQEMTLTTKLFNNEAQAVTVKSLAYTLEDGQVIGTDTTGYTIAADGTVDVTFNYTPTVAKRMTITVTAVITVDGKDLTYTKDITITVRETAELPVTPIGTVNKQTEAGYEYAIEGIVTSNASGYDKDTAFFDCIYVQDETGGVCCFPVSGEYKIGDKVHIEGYVDFYQGEIELQVYPDSMKVIGTGTVEPREVNAENINDLTYLGELVTLKGTVQSFEVVNGLIQTIMVEDNKGDVARVFIDGYITTENEVVGCEVGAEITVTGISSYDDTFNAPEGPFPRIRIRNRADVVCKVEEPTVNITVSKIWDTVNMEAPQGATVTFGLNANGIDTGYTISLDGVKDFEKSNPGVSETAPWEATFAGLDKYDSNGNEIVYSVREIGSVPGFTTRYPNGQNYALNGEAITNTQEITSVTVSKAWVNADGTTTAPEGAAVKFTLYADGEDTGFNVTLTGQEDGDPIMQGGQEHEPWTAVFVRLPKYKVVNGATVEINYTVTETETWPGYEVSYGAEDATFAVDGGTITNTEKPVEPTIPHLRVKGSNRYDTAFMAANYMKEVKGVDKFDTVVVAYGGNFADALSGSYLAAVAEAPILLVHPSYEQKVFDYIKENTTEGAKIYLLGGKGAVSEEFEALLEGYDVERLGGKNRYDTNLLILDAANQIDDSSIHEVLVCSGANFADALSTSSVGKPILLVSGDAMTETQTKYLTENEVGKAWIIGGKGAVSEEIEAQLETFLPTENIKRVKGANRYETSYEVAKEFFGGNYETAVIVYGQDFPDGLSGGAVASVIGSPVLLAMNNDTLIANAAKWVAESGATKSVTFGGATLISDDSIRTIMNQPEAVIVLFE